MAECAFRNDPDSPCPIPDEFEYYRLRERCRPGEYGHNCAAILGQTILANTYSPETLESSVDNEFGLIVANLRLTQTPEGEAPLEVRDVVGQRTFPLRERRPDIPGHSVAHVDLVLTLLNAEKLKEARWYSEHSRQLQQHGSDEQLWWSFAEEEGVVSELHTPMSSLDHYDQSFSLGSAALSNSHLPPLLEIRALKTGRGLPTTVDIKDYLNT